MRLPTETLEKLAIDRRLGELTEDAAALYDAYLAQNPDDASAITTIDQTVDLVRAALDDGPFEPVLPLPLPGFFRAARRANAARRIRDGLTGFAVAASLALFAWLGTGVSPVGSTNSATGGIAQSRTGSAETSKPGFWSLSSLKVDRVPPRSDGQSSIEWTGPITKPNIGA